MNDWQKIVCLVLLGCGIILYQPFDLRNTISAVLMIFPSLLLGKEILKFELKKKELI